MNEEMEVTITIKYLVTLAGETGRQTEEVCFPDGSTLHDVARYLKETRNITLPSPQIMTILNGIGWNQHQDSWDTLIKNGDTILLFPPLSGG
ncbi:MAG: MoaD/ThiS family protein [Bacteroidetes bacterium]|nr:MoaD/ThiS family protein [Bacteroidota bacterium]